MSTAINERETPINTNAATLHPSGTRDLDFDFFLVVVVVTVVDACGVERIGAMVMFGEPPDGTVVGAAVVVAFEALLEFEAAAKPLAATSNSSSTACRCILIFILFYLKGPWLIGYAVYSWSMPMMPSAAAITRTRASQACLTSADGGCPPEIFWTSSIVTSA